MAHDNEPRAEIDFETRSAADIKTLGGWMYSRHPTTKLMCLCYRLPYEHFRDASKSGIDFKAFSNSHEKRYWYPDWIADEAGVARMPPPQDLFDWIAKGGAVEAHNVLFELAVWRNVCQPKHGWPEWPLEQARCSAAKASSYSLPRDLDGATKALHLDTVKDLDGKKHMLRLSKPIKLTKAMAAVHGPDALLWHEVTAEDLERLLAYCHDDVAAEAALSDYLRDLSKQESRVFHADLRICMRGVPIDLAMARGAVKIAGEAKAEANRKLCELTEGRVTKATQRGAIREWLLETQGVEVPDTTADTIDVMLEAVGELRDHVPVLEREDDDGDSRRVAKLRRLAMSAPKTALLALRYVREAGRAAAAKYQAALDRTDPTDGRVRDVFVYHGADTGRWVSRALQMHNMAKGKPPTGWSKRDWNEWGYDAACEAIASGNMRWLQALIGVDALDVLRTCVRGLIVAPRGTKLAPVDYSSVEARILLWLAGATRALHVFETGGDIYCDLASEIYRRTITKADERERQLGKQGILGLGFGMGAPKFLITLRKYGISFTEAECRAIVGSDYDRLSEEWLAPPSEEGQEAKWERAASLGMTSWDLPELIVCSYVVETYRRRYPEVVEFWARMEQCALEAAQHNRKEVRVNDKVSFKRVGRFLMMRLPSGRTIKYCEPKVKPKKTPWGEWRDTLYYMGLDSKTKQWCEKSTYSGSLTENAVQGTARDALADVIVRLEIEQELGLYVQIVSHVHDEGVPLVPDTWDSVDPLERSFVSKPKWLEGCPIGAEGKLLTRYRK